MLPISAPPLPFTSFFFFNDTATTEIYTLSLHDALPICRAAGGPWVPFQLVGELRYPVDRKSTRLNSSHHGISYAVFCLKKKKKMKKKSGEKKKSGRPGHSQRRSTVL